MQTRSKNQHCSIALHGWCVDEYEKETKEKLSFDEQNFRAGQMVIERAIFCFQRSLGAQDFVAMNALNQHTKIENNATRNDSGASFFKIRNVAFEVLSEKIQNN